MAFEIGLEFILNQDRQSMLEHRADFSSIRAMSITYREEMTMSETHYMWIGDIRILIHFIGVVSGDATFGSKRELSDYVG